MNDLELALERARIRAEARWRITARLGEHIERLGVDMDSVIARDVGLTRERIRQYRVLLGIAKPQKTRPKEELSEETLEVVRLRNENTLTNVQISEVLEIPRTSVTRALNAAVRHGMKISRRWSPERIAELQRRWNAMEPVAVLARDFHIKRLHPRIYLFRLQGHDFVKRKGRGAPHKDIADLEPIAEKWRAGLSAKEIAADLGLAVQRVHHLVQAGRRRGMDIPLRPAFGLKTA